nr:acyl-CoA carboxylase subunit epsilon [Actinomycetales bacterium]
MTPEFDVVAGAPSETELAALVAVGTAVQSINELLETGEAPPEPVPGTVARCSEWTSRGRRGAMRNAGMPVPGTFSGEWRWSLHP